MTSLLVKRGAFLHIPKTGGTWITSVLGAAGLVKGPIGHEHNYSKGPAQWAFCTVRNPVNWWLSMWRDRVDRMWEPFSGGPAHPLYPLWEIGETDIETWIDIAATRFAGFCGDLYGLYTTNAQHILRLENLRDDLGVLAQTVGWPPLDLDMPAVNVSRQLISRDALDTSRLLETETKAFKIWNAAGMPVLNEFSI